MAEDLERAFTEQVRDLAEFGYPNAVINTARISYTALFEVEGMGLTIRLKAVCDGALLDFGFEENERAQAEAMFQFFKSCMEKYT